MTKFVVIVTVVMTGNLTFDVHEMTTMNIVMVITCTQQSTVRNVILKYDNSVSYDTTTEVWYKYVEHRALCCDCIIYTFKRSKQQTNNRVTC